MPVFRGKKQIGARSGDNIRQDAAVAYDGIEVSLRIAGTDIAGEGAILAERSIELDLGRGPEL